MYKIAICDDNPMYLNTIAKMVKEICSNVFPCEIKKYENGMHLYYDVEEKQYFDIYLLDIEMPEISGMETARKIKKLHPSALIIFITSYSEYVYDSFALSVFRYIPKAALESRLRQALIDAFQFLSLQKDEYYKLINAATVLKIPYKEIYYIYKNQKNAIFVLDDREERERKSLTSVYEELNSDEFIFVERGYIVNIYNVIGIKENNLILRNETLIPISRSHLKDVKTAFSQYWSKNI